jgi:hypothetical protein
MEGQGGGDEQGLHADFMNMVFNQILLIKTNPHIK